MGFRGSRVLPSGACLTRAYAKTTWSLLSASPFEANQFQHYNTGYKDCDSPRSDGPLTVHIQIVMES